MGKPGSIGGGLRRSAGRATLLSLLAILSSCIVEERPRPSRLQRTSPASVAPASPQEKPTLPAGPVGKPAPANSSTSAFVRFTILPLGTVAYDGQVLPLVSPDGRFMAVEDGDPPTWPTLLAQSDAIPALGTRLVVYDLTGTALKPIPPVEKPPVGAVLGRSTDSRGFLIELPRPDGSRWIGRCDWVGGKVQWLVQDDAVNAHGVLAPDGTLAYTSRAVGAKLNQLVVRDPDGAGRALTLSDTSFALPLFSSDGRIVYTLAITAEALELMAVRVVYSDGTRPAVLGTVLSRRVLAAGGDMALAYQVVLPSQPNPSIGAPHAIGQGPGAPNDPSAADIPDENPPLIFHPTLDRMAAFDWRNSLFIPLAAKSVAAVHSPLPQNPGYFQTTPAGLIYTPPLDQAAAIPGADDRPKPRAEARVMDTPFVPRATTDPARPLVLLGPGPSNRLQVVSFGVLPAAPAPRTK